MNISVEFYEFLSRRRNLARSAIIEFIRIIRFIKIIKSVRIFLFIGIFLLVFSESDLTNFLLNAQYFLNQNPVLQNHFHFKIKIIINIIVSRGRTGNSHFLRSRCAYLKEVYHQSRKFFILLCYLLIF